MACVAYAGAKDMNLYEAIKGRRHYLPEAKAGASEVRQQPASLVATFVHQK